MVDKLLFGTAGIPLTTPDRNLLNGIGYLDKLNLDGMELEFVRSVNVNEALAQKIDDQRKKYNKLLTCHGQYFINLSSLEKPKIHASIDRILNAARIANLCGAWSLTFHAAFYQKQDAKKVYNDVKGHLKTIRKTLDDESNDIWIRPETTGKGTQFGTIDEILKLSNDIDGVMPCIDFSHLHARSVGKYNTYDEFTEVLEKVEKALGKNGLNNMHIHLSGINYGEKGERNHLILEESDMNYKDFLKTLKEFNAKGIVISESPNIEEDAILMKKYYSEL